MNIDQSRKPRIGFACGGGFIRSVSQIGVLEVLQENDIKIDMFSGCSAGGPMAAAFAAGSLQQLKKRVLEGSPKEYRAVIFEPTIPIQGLLKGDRNRIFFAEFVGDKTFADLETKLALVTTDLHDMSEVILQEGILSKAMQACTSVPGVFVPVKWGDMLLADGGNFNLLPTKPLYDAGMEYVIAVDCSQPPNIFTRTFSKIKQLLNIRPVVKVRGRMGRKEKLNIFQIMGRAFSLSSGQIRNFNHSSYRYNILIQPDLVDVKRWHVSKAEFVYLKGRKAAEAAIPQIKKDLGIV